MTHATHRRSPHTPSRSMPGGYLGVTAAMEPHLIFHTTQRTSRHCVLSRQRRNRAFVRRRQHTARSFAGHGHPRARLHSAFQKQSHVLCGRSAMNFPFARQVRRNSAENTPAHLAGARAMFHVVQRGQQPSARQRLRILSARTSRTCRAVAVAQTARMHPSAAALAALQDTCVAIALTLAIRVSPSETLARVRASMRVRTVSTFRGAPSAMAQALWESRSLHTPVRMSVAA